MTLNILKVISMNHVIGSNLLYSTIAILFILSILIFIRVKSLKIRTPLLVIIVLAGFFVKKELLFISLHAKSKVADSDFISLLFSVLYFYLFLSLIYSYINKLIGNKLGDRSKFITKLLKITSFVFLVMCFGERFYLSASGIITFGSVGGIIIGMSSKAVLSNFISGIMLYFDRPFNVGDSVCSPQDKISGTVSKIGLRITTLISDENKPIYIPNSLFSTLIIINSSRAADKKIVIKLTIPISSYNGVSGFIEDIIDEISKDNLIEEGSVKCYIYDVTQDSILMQLSCFVQQSNYSNFNEIKKFRGD